MTILSGPPRVTKGVVDLIDASQLSKGVRGDVLYKVTGILNLTGAGINFEIPPEGISIEGSNTILSKIVCDDDNYTLFTSPPEGSGTVLFNKLTFSVSGNNSKVYDIFDTNGFNAFEIDTVNYENCSSLGEINGYRQGLEINTGRFGKTPELTLSGSWGGFRISTSIATNLQDLDALFKVGTGFSLNGRFLSDIRCNLPTVGAFTDISSSDINGDELFQLRGANFTRNNVSNIEDEGILPNLSARDSVSYIKDCTGIKNTKKILACTLDTEIPNTINSVNVYEPLLGGWTSSKQSHMSLNTDNTFEVLTGSNYYNTQSQLLIRGTQGKVLSVRLVKSIDGGLTFPIILTESRSKVINLVGQEDLATFNIYSVDELSKGDILRFEVSNTTDGSSVTLISGNSFINIFEV